MMIVGKGVANESYDLAQLVSVADFQRENSTLYKNVNQLRWYLRDRHENGLVKSGAVIEIRNKPDSSKPALRIHRANWWKWMEQGGAH